MRIPIRFLSNNFREPTQSVTLKSDATMRQLSSERRRLKRIRERHADTICFACREKGHAAKDCPAGDTALEGDDANNTRNALGKDAVGMCYR